MYTRCNGCHTVHPLNAALLAQGAGKYRCGKCNKLNNALETLFDEWPNAGQAGPTQTGTPKLGIKLDISPQQPGDDSDGEEFPSGRPQAGRSKFSRAAWAATAVALIIITGLNLAWLFKAKLLDSSLVKENPQISYRLAQWGVIEARPVIPQRNIDQLSLSGSDLRSHPSLVGALRLSTMIMNRADGRRAYPELEVLLLDSNGQAMSGRRFKPEEYLAEGADIENGMTPQAVLPVVLDLSNPGHQAVGFEIRIR
jgi:predicted Zn finger-like uncharacterized protein